MSGQPVAKTPCKLGEAENFLQAERHSGIVVQEIEVL